MATVSMSWSLPTINDSFPSHLRRPNRLHSVMTSASLKKEISGVGVRVTEGQGNLPKVVLSSPHGRCAYSLTPIALNCATATQDHECLVVFHGPEK